MFTFNLPLFSHAAANMRLIERTASAVNRSACIVCLFQVLQNFKLDYRGDDVNPVLTFFLTPDRPLKIVFVPRDA
jgi:hypothetical protein